MRALPKSLAKFPRYVAVVVAFVVVVTALLLWLSGRFTPKIRSAIAPEASTVNAVSPAGMIVDVRSLRIPLTEQAVGTIQAQYQAAVASRIVSRVMQIDLLAGQTVKKGDLLVRLDDTDLQARLHQAESVVAAATAQHDQAVIDEKRLRSLMESRAVSQTEYDRALTLLKTTEADLARAKQAAGEASAILTYTSILAPMDGVVVDKKVNVGDTAMPGQPLLTIYDAERMQLVANVRESLARRLKVGQEIGVRLDVLSKDCVGRISEVVPDAQSASRTFQVKVTGPCPPGLYTGMFGRILIPLELRDVLVIPQSAVRRVGQLEMVDVAEDGAIHRRAVRIGRTLGDEYEVLSGLQVGERIVVPEQAKLSSPSTQASPKVGL